VTPVEDRVAARLREVAALAGPPGGDATATRTLDRARADRRRTAVRGAAVVAVVLAAVVNVLAGPHRGDPFPARGWDSLAALAAPSAPEYYDQPTRGSLADDEDFLADVAALDWDGPEVNGRVWGNAASSRRVVYAADVPGGHRWAVVLARSGVQWTWAWFTGPAGADAADLTLAVGSDRIVAGHVLALMDTSGPTAPLVVLGRPGDGAEYSPSVDRTADGALVRTFAPLPLVDGVLLGEVPAPVTWDSGQVVLDRDGARIDVDLVTTGQPPSTVVVPSGPPDLAVLVPCMAALGLDVQPDGSWSDPWLGQSSADRAAQNTAVLDCLATAATGG
jgi:hypothetical protein